MSDPEQSLRPRQRRARIAELLRVGPASVEDLAARFDVSLSTVRRDLERLSADGTIHRTYGGAVPATSSRERTLREREHLEGRAKAEIAALAVDLIDDGATILLDAGTSVGALARLVAGRSGLTIVTNSLTTAELLSSTESGHEIVLLGGALRPISGSTVGPIAEEALRSITVDAAFLSGDGVDAVRGISERTERQAALKRAMIAAAGTVHVLADATKLGSADAHWWARIEAPWSLLTDAAASETQLAPFRERGVLVRVAPRSAQTD